MGEMGCGGGALLWEEYCLVTLSVVCAGRAVPFEWIALKHRSASVEFSVYQPLLEKTRHRLDQFSHVTLLADRGFANHDLVQWLKGTHWHWCIRVPGDTTVYYCQGRRSFSREVRQLYPPKGEARFYRQVKLWVDGALECHLALARLRGVKEAWAVITDEPPSLETFWRYGLRFRTEELYLDSKSGVFELERSKIRNAAQLERLYLGAAIAILFATLTGMALQKQGLRQQVDPHWKRGLSYLKMGLRWLAGVLHKGRPLLALSELLLHDPARCFASRKAKEEFFNQFFFYGFEPSPLVQTGQRASFDWHGKRGLSSLQLGLRQLAGLCYQRLPLPSLAALPKINPPPACASRKKRTRLDCRIEFSKVVSFSY